MQTQSTIIRDYANGLADGFLRDLTLAEERGFESPSDINAAFLTYVSELRANQYPLTLFTARP